MVAGYTKEQVIARMKYDLGHQNTQNFMYCRQGVQTVLDLLLASTNNNTNKTIKLPEPAPEMLWVLYGSGNNKYLSAYGQSTALTRYNRLKAILERPATKTVTLYVVSWQNRDGNAIAFSYQHHNEASVHEAQLKLEGHKHVTVTEIQQTVDDV